MGAMVTRLRATLLGVFLSLVSAPAGAITGVCPDGSIFIVREKAQVPCVGAKEVESSKVPPLRPENLPRPYLWEVYREQADQGRNPYHLLDRAEQVRGAPRASTQPAPVSSAPPAPESGALESSRSAGGSPLALREDEVRDLFYLVELSQQEVPATFVANEGGRERMRVAFAHSRAFEERVQNDAAFSGAPLLFSVVAAGDTEFYPNLTFVQGHLAFQPNTEHAAELGWLYGGAGAFGSDQVALGYVNLPRDFDLTAPLDLYWNDQRQSGLVLRP